MSDVKRLPRSAAVFLLALFASPAALAQNAQNPLQIYGYLAWRLEKVWDELSRDGSGATVKTEAPREISLPSFNVMMQYKINERFKTFVNLSGAEAEDLSVNNIWGEYAHNQYVNLRFGKSYRRFGLYNERLDAVPTYIGIEPPELFDKDHLILSRTTLFMAHGWVPLGAGELHYSLSTDNGEGGPTSDDNVPLGFDMRYNFGLGNYTVGISAYTSNGDTTSDVALGDGSPRSGVLPWMAADDFHVLGSFGEFQIGNWLIQAEYWRASHDAERDPESILAVLANAGVNDSQRARFLIDPAGPEVASNVDTDGDYDITTWFVRAGYSRETSYGEIVPYFQWDFYKNPETIENKDWGGDAEAGLADDGEFTKVTLGIIYRPVPSVAFKADASVHTQKFNGEDERYPEIRIDVSYIFGR
jgi:hypothetical protein